MLREDRHTHHLGALHQQHLEAEGLRNRQGSFYTPSHIVEGLLDVCLAPILEERSGDLSALARVRVLDPACGSGNFLAGAARRIVQSLVSAGAQPSVAVRIAFSECIIGVDIDESAVLLSRQALALESGTVLDQADLESNVIVADALDMDFSDGPLQLFASEDSPNWARLMEDWGSESGFDLVVGNPPFLSQLSSSTARSKAQTYREHSRFGSAVGKLTDTSAVFLLLGAKLTRTRGTVCMIQPLSFLAARDAAGVRETLIRTGSLTHVWVARERVFDAEVDVCAVVSRPDVEQGSVELLTGPEFLSGPSVLLGPEDASTWSRLLAATSGVPRRNLATEGVVADVATATSDFRDFYYGISPHVVEGASSGNSLPRVLTVGLIDIAVIRWGEQSTRINKRRFERPHLEVSELDLGLKRRVEELLVPKVVLATQTRTLEAAVDEDGVFVPSVPVVSIIPQAIDLWHLVAAVNAPPVLLVALQRHSGSGLGAEALRLSARDALALPLPRDDQAWSEAARLIEAVTRSRAGKERAALLREYASAASAAYGCAGDQELIDWWWGRLPRGDRDSQERLGTPSGSLQSD